MNTRSFGSWTFNSKNLTLLHENPTYEIDLERCTSSAQVLDWIFQINAKTWADDFCVADLVHAFRVTLDPQRTLCSFGREKPAEYRAKRVFPFQKKESDTPSWWYERG